MVGKFEKQETKFLLKCEALVEFKRDYLPSIYKILE